MLNGGCGYPVAQSTVRVRAAAALGAMLQLVHERQSFPQCSRNVLIKIEEGVLEKRGLYEGFGLFGRVRVLLIKRKKHCITSSDLKIYNFLY